MNNWKDAIFQSAGDSAIEMFERKLRGPSIYGHCGFDSHAKAMDPSLAEREELNLGYMSDRELAAEIATLNDYLREERGMYERGMHFFNILDGAQQRIRHLSKRLERALGKEVFDAEANVQMVGRLKKLDGQGEFVDKGVEVRVVPDDEQAAKPAQFICADGGQIEQAPSITVGAELGADFAGDPDYIEIKIPTDQPSPGDLVTVPGLAEGRAIVGNESVMVSRGFNVSWGDFKKNVDLHSSVIIRIGVLVDRLCFKLGVVLREEKLSALATKILQKHPEVSDELVLACFEAANPDMVTASTETLNELYKAWLELVEIVDPRPPTVKE